MGPTDLSALRALTKQKSWRINSLPPGVGVDELRAWDVDGLIEARPWVLQNHTTDSRHPIPVVPEPWSRGWVSPASNRDLMGRWDDIFRQSSEHPNTAAEVQLTEKGKVAIEHEERWRMEVHADLLRARHAPLYPGRLLVVKADSFNFHPTDDAQYDRSSHVLLGVALWDSAPDDQIGSVRVELPGGEERLVPLLASDRKRPSSGNSLVDAWIQRADVLALLLTDRGRPVGMPVLTTAQWRAAKLCMTKVLRDAAQRVIDVAPNTARQALLALARIVDSEAPDPSLLTQAIEELRVAKPAEWKPVANRKARARIEPKTLPRRGSATNAKASRSRHKAAEKQSSNSPIVRLTADLVDAEKQRRKEGKQSKAYLEMKRKARAWRKNQQPTRNPEIRGVEGSPKRDAQAQAERLSSMENHILIALAEKKCFARESRVVTDKLAGLAGYGKAASGPFKLHVAGLQRQELVGTKSGRNGGVWLTDAGRRVAEICSRNGTD